jgi:hypothetical protein
MTWDGAIAAVSWPSERTVRAVAAAQGKARDQGAKRRRRAASGEQSERHSIAIGVSRHAQGHVEADTSRTWDMKTHFKKIIVNF